MQIFTRFFLLAVLLIAFAAASTAVASDRPAQSSYLNKPNTEPLPLDDGSEGVDFSNTVTFTGQSLGPGEIMGMTVQDHQHNGSMGRQVVYDALNDRVHFTWMWFEFNEEPRRMKYNAYNSDGTWAHGSGMTGGVALETTIRQGYGGIDLGLDGRAMVHHHQGPSTDSYASAAGFDIDPPNADFTFFTAPSPSVDGVINCEGWITGGTEYNSAYIWPKAEFDTCGGQQIVHMVATESPPPSAPAGEIQTVVYYRGIADSVTGAISWPSCPMAVDSVYVLSALVREDPLSDEVAISWLKPIYYEDDPDDPCGLTQWQNDVMVWKSTDCGVTWDPSNLTNVTDYLGNNGTIEDVSLAYTDHSMLYDSDGYLHIVWSTPLNPPNDEDPCGKSFGTKIWHWSDAPDGCISLVYDATKPTYHCDTGAWNMSTCKMNISECDGKFYVSFTRFGAYTSADGDTNLDCSNAGYANGDIFLTGSTNGGKSWGEALNLTSTATPDCMTGDCLSEHWSSMAKQSTGNVHIQYIEDLDPGGFQDNEGAPTDNPVKYLEYPCFTPETFCQYSYSPHSIGYPTAIAPQGMVGCTIDETTTFTLTIENSGNESSAYYVTPSESWITRVGGDPLTGTIDAGCNHTKEIELQLGPIADVGIYAAQIDIGVCGQVKTIPVELIVYCEIQFPEYQILSTACWSVGVWNVPRVGLAQMSDLGNMHWFAEEIALMYDEGLVISYDDTTQTFFSIFDGADDSVSFAALSAFTVETMPNHEYATSEFATPDTNICGTVEYFLPIHLDTCVLIEKVTVSNCDDVAHTVSVGEGVDWDIPDGDDGSDNRAGMDESRQMLYQYGPGDGSPFDNVYGGLAFSPQVISIAGGVILNNYDWVYPNGGYDPAQIGGLLSRIDGLDASYDSVFDLSSFFAIVQDTLLQPGESITFCKVKTSSLDGLTGLQAMIDRGFKWAADNDVCGYFIPDCFGGDANNSGGVDIDDIVYLIAYVFQGGPEPAIHECCVDANCDCTVDIDDIVFLIQWVFQGPTPWPCTCEDWFDNCWQQE